MEKDLKDILLKDLCARLPYKTEIQVNDWAILTATLKVGHISRLLNEDLEIKPYLFPLSSMTEEQRKEYARAQSDDGDIVFSRAIKYVETGADIVSAEYHATDWLNAHHFDYRGLIEKELAIDATGLNIY